MTVVGLGLPSVRLTGAEPAPEDRPRTDSLIDRFGRVATDLRVSLTDRCNLRCAYCMPAEGLDWLPREQILDDDEVVRLVRVAVDRLGISAIRFTGGEPLLRAGLERIVAETSRMRTAEGLPVRTSLTTNAMGLRHRARKLAAAGLSRINVSLDTLDPERFAAITHRDRHHEVIAGLHSAREAGLAPVKVNAVLVPGINDTEAAAMLRWALDEGYLLRFIEQMPLDAQGAWSRDGMVTADDILAQLRQEFDLEPMEPTARGAAPAETWWARDKRDHARGGTVGVIASVTRSFCAACDRSRLTADGQIRNCLFATSETDIRSLMRAGADDEAIARAWRGAMWAKRAGHGTDARSEDTGFARASRPMSAIGG